MKKPPRTFLLVEAVLDENDVPYLVADARMPSRRVGIERVHPVPKNVDHFAEHFKPRAHPVDATDPRHRAHYEREQRAGTLKIHGSSQAKDTDDAAATFKAIAEAKAAQEAAAAKAKADAQQQLEDAEKVEQAAKAQLAQAEIAATHAAAPPQPPPASSSSSSAAAHPG